MLTAEALATTAVEFGGATNCYASFVFIFDRM